MMRPGVPRTVEGWCLLGLAALALVYLATVLPALGDDPIVGGDEGWIMSAAGKLATDGVFGSDLFRGFYGSESHYYFNLPLHHIALAGVFKLIGIGVAQARLVSVVYGLVLLALTYSLGRRIGGPVVGLASAALLVLLRLNLAPFSGLTLTDLGATVRYDLAAVPYGIAAMLVVSRRLESPTPRLIASAGLLIGIGGVTQFIGAFFALPLAVFLLTLALPWSRRLLLVAVLAAATIVPFLPYGAYAVTHRDDFRGQSRTVEQETDFLSPRYYWDTIRHEPDRYKIGTQLQRFPDSLRDAARRPSARLALFVVGPIALVYTLARGRRELPYRLLGFTLAGIIMELMLFESTKRFVYWVVAVPLVCVAVADLAFWLWTRGVTLTSSNRIALVRAAVAAVALIFAVEGAVVAAKDVRDAHTHAGDYAALGRKLNDALPEGASAMGDNRMWPLLRDRDYRSLLLVFYMTNPRISRENTTDVGGAIEEAGVDYLLLSPLSREILTKLTPEDHAAFDEFLSKRTRQETTIDDKTYGPIDVYRVLP